MATYSAGCSAVGSFGYSNRFTLYVELSNRDGDPSTNQSIVDYNVYFQNTSGGGTFTSQTRLYFRLNGIVLRDETLSVTGPRNGTVSIASGSMAVPHNDDGSQRVTFQALVQSTSYGILGNIEDGFTLTTIPRKSSISCSTANIGANATIIINRASSSFTHTLRYAFGNLSGTIATGVGTSYSWTIPTSFYTQIPDNKMGAGTLWCDTYSGSTLIGTSAIVFYVTTDESVCRPTVSGTIKDINPSTLALTGNENKLIKNASTVQIDVSPVVRNSATIKTVKIDGVTVTNNQRIIEKATKASFPIEVTDTRDYVNTAYSVVAKDGIIDYIALTLNATFFRPQPTTGEVQLTYSGKYFEGSFGTVDNELEIKWFYKEKGAEEWIEGGILSPEISENKISEETISLGEIYDYQKEYEFQIIATDKLTTAIRTSSVSMGLPVFNWGKDFLNVNGDFRINNISRLPIILYDNPSGTTGTVTLSESGDNFTHLDIFYLDTYSNKQNSKRIDLNVSKSFVLDGMSYASHISQNYSTSYAISGTSITVSSQVAFNRNYTSGAIAGDIQNNLVKVLRVVGYR